MGKAFKYLVFYVVAFQMFTSLSNCYAESDNIYRAQHRKCNKERFQRFSISVEQEIRVASKVDFSTRPAARKFKTRINQEFSLGPNYAGRYTVAVWGGGSPICFDFAIIESQSGKILYYSPVDSQKQNIYQPCAEPLFQLDSSLIIFDPGCEEEPNFWADRMSAANGRNWGTIPTFATFKENKFEREWLPYKQWGPDNNPIENNLQH
ncbi:MAG: hypothetical protein AB7H97_02090 [Pseudobdellovibrionaceae bacterium]